MQAMSIASDIRAAFIANLKDQDWMDEETRKVAKRKVRKHHSRELS